jgi:Peroxiredoxin
MKWLLPNALIVLAVLLTGCRDEGQLKIGTPAPELGALTLDEQPATLKTWRGKLVYLVFWSDSCGGCFAEMASLQALFLRYQQDLVIVGISTDASAARIRAVQQQMGLTYPQLRDQLNISSERYQLQGTPSAYLLDREGRLLAQSLGLQKPAALEQQFKQLIP